MILLDASGLFAALDEAEPEHLAAAEALRAARGPRLLSPFVLAELDYLLATRVGQGAELALLDEVARGAYRIEPFGAGDVASAREVVARYADLEIGLADASIVVLADRHSTVDVLTLDRRHFGALRGPGGRPFQLVP